jgi:hypothetical protein
VKSFELHPEAIGDVDEIAAYFRDFSPEMPSRLVGEFFAAFELLV